MERYRFWIFLGLGVAAALSLKYIGGSDTDPDRWRSLHAKTAFAEDDGENTRALHARHVGSPFTKKVGALEPRTVKTPAKPTPPPPTAAAKKVDPKKDAKKDDKKKDAKKKEATDKNKEGSPFGAPAAGNTAADSTSPFGDRENNPPSGAGDGGLADQAANKQATFAAASSANNPTKWTLAEWESDLLNEPNTTETQRFISLYKSGAVTSTIFYDIVNMMLEDSRQAMRQLGVTCLSSTPSVASLTLLIPLQSNSTSAIQTQAQQALSAYTTVQNLPILYTILQSDSSLTTEALTLLTTSAQNNLGTTATTTGGTTTSSSGATTLSTQSSLQQSYSAFLAVLQNLTTQGNTQVQTAASQTLSTLESLLSNSGAAAKVFYSRHRSDWSS